LPGKAHIAGGEVIADILSRARLGNLQTVKKFSTGDDTRDESFLVVVDPSRVCQR
jgi:hypothetical protein